MPNHAKCSSDNLFNRAVKCSDCILDNCAILLLPEYHGALGWRSGVSRTPHNRSPAAACSSTIHDLQQSDTACRESTTNHSNLYGRREGKWNDVNPDSLFWVSSSTVLCWNLEFGAQYIWFVGLTYSCSYPCSSHRGRCSMPQGPGLCASPSPPGSAAVGRPCLKNRTK